MKGTTLRKIGTYEKCDQRHWHFQIGNLKIIYNLPWWYWITELITCTAQTIGSFTNWGRVTHICVNNLTIIGPDNGLSPGRRQAIIWTNAGMLLFGLLGTNFNEILLEIHTYSFKKIHFKMSSGKWRPFRLDLKYKLWRMSINRH